MLLFLSLFSFRVAMKYAISTDTIPQSKRKAVNDKILLFIESGRAGEFGSEAIFNGYTGDGGLHGLEFSNYKSYSAYSEAKKEIENGQFFTPASICELMVKSVPVSSSDLVADITCGMGNFFNFLPVETNVYGCELDYKSYKVASHLYPFAQIENKDIRYYNPQVKFDVIFGNPPFNIYWRTPKGEMKSQHYFMHKAHELLISGGILAILVPASYLADTFIDRHTIEEVDGMFSFLTQVKLPSNAFKSVGVSNFPSKIMFFQKNFEGITKRPYALTFTDFNPDIIASTIIRPALEEKNKVSAKASLNQDKSENDWSFSNIALRNSDGFHFQIRKYLYEIKKHKALIDKYQRAVAYIHKYQTQEQPEGLKYEDWEKIKITPAKVISYLKQIVRSKTTSNKKGFSIYNDSNGIHFRAHDAITGSKFKELSITDLSWIDLIHGKASLDNHYFSSKLKPYKKLLEKKRKHYQAVQADLRKTEIASESIEFLNNYSFVTPKLEVARLNDIQSKDIAIMLNRSYGILSWEQGSGKTVSGYAAIKYSLQCRNVKNAFVIGPPIAIEGTWIPFLTRQNASFRVIKNYCDISQIMPGEIVVIAITTIKKSKRMVKELKRFIKTIARKAFLLFDESDEITNYNSKRSHAVRNVFRNLKYKLLTTGTTTRNNIAELYGQLELLYNNSFNMISDCSKVYFEEKSSDADGCSSIAIKERDNKYFNKPYPARGGYQLFKASYSPSKSTVFGIQKLNQDIYNYDSLKRIVKRTIITRKFKEIAGDGRYKLNTHRIVAKPFEYDLFNKIMNELHTIIPGYFRSTGNGRKDYMLRIVRQLQLSIKSCSVAHKMLGNAELPAKASFIKDLVSQFHDERIMIGSTSITAAKFYLEYLSEKFPTREIFFVTGKTHTVEERKIVVDKFKRSLNGILVCTQQSLSSSIDIPECSRVICESLQWNVPKMSQFYFRAIRFTSERPTNIHFLIYSNSIEVNLMALLTAKERLNDFIKTLDLRNHNEVMEDFDLDASLLDSLVRKLYNEDGTVRYTWGKQLLAA